MDKKEFEKKLTKKLLEVRKLSEQFFADNPEYDCSNNGYLSMTVWRDSIRANTSQKRSENVSIFKDIPVIDKNPE